jgi:hypothetical protein
MRPILERARAAGIAVDWIDAANQPQRVAIPSLTRILESLGDGPRATAPVLVTATVGEAISLSDVDGESPGELRLEGRDTKSITVSSRLPPIAEPGYHTLRWRDRELTVAVAPTRCFTIADIAPGRRLWGLAVQLYSLKRPGDGGIGDTTGLAMLAESAAAHGADALALSPAHSLFPDDTARFGPYRPRAAVSQSPADRSGGRLAAPSPPEAANALIDWPGRRHGIRRCCAGSTRLQRDDGTASSSSRRSCARAGRPRRPRPLRGARGPRPVLRLPAMAGRRAFAAAQRRRATPACDRPDQRPGDRPRSRGRRSAPTDAFLTDLRIGAPPDASIPTARIGASPRSRRRPWSRAVSRPSSTRCAPTCGMPAGCGSTTRWG